MTFQMLLKDQDLLKFGQKNTIIEQYLVPSLSTNVAFLIRINF